MRDGAANTTLVSAHDLPAGLAERPSDRQDLPSGRHDLPSGQQATEATMEARLEECGWQAAPTSRIASAALAAGDAYRPLPGQWRLRATGVLLLASAVVYEWWALSSLNGSVPWVAWPFAAANVFSLLYLSVNVINGWERRVPPLEPLAHGGEPHVAIIIPTCGEQVPMILRTVVSVFDQSWPLDRMTVVVSDDGHDPDLEAALACIPVLYHSPPPLYAPGRDGAAKAGNLNSALDMLALRYPEITYIETRDADDELGSHNFLRQVVGQLELDGRLAFVQTVKEAQVGPGDPFENLASMFYRGQMLSRNAANAVFPCGSGLVWRRSALADIGDFPTWNLVEDLQSGMEALRRGWRGLYLPIVGAVGQHAPHDLPNFYKQRGTWALDTARLMLWRPSRGLTIRQRLHFFGMLMDLLNALTLLVYVPAVALSMLGWDPITASGSSYLSHMVALVVLTEIWMLQHNTPFNDRRRRRRRPIRALWQTRIVCTGLTFVFVRATITAALGGSKRKPLYRVTRKEDQARWYWRETLPHLAAVALIGSALIIGVVRADLSRPALLLGPLYWGGTYVVLLCGFIRRGWYGVELPGLKRLLPAKPYAWSMGLRTAAWSMRWRTTAWANRLCSADWSNGVGGGAAAAARTDGFPQVSHQSRADSPRTGRVQVAPIRLPRALCLPAGPDASG